MSPKHTVALWALGRIYSEQLPQIALRWLELGLDSLDLRILAGETNPIMSDVGPMFETVLEELEFAVPTFVEAIARLSSETAQKIVDGSVSPFEGACEIESFCVDYDSEFETNFAFIFFNLTDQYREFNDHQRRAYYGEEHCRRVRHELDAKIIAEARKLMV